nr:MAG TPA: hypothetical protein [Bacteriophage sp.]
MQAVKFPQFLTKSRTFYNFRQINSLKNNQSNTHHKKFSVLNQFFTKYN